jgi:PAS domain S-box-containing protein
MRFLRAQGTADSKGLAILLGLYASVSVLWILGTDLIVRLLLPNDKLVHSAKGMVFVVGSTTILFFVARRFLRDTQRLQFTLEQIFQQPEVGIFFSDLNGVILENNEALAKFLGLTRAEIVGESVSKLLRIEDLAPTWAQLASQEKLTGNNIRTRSVKHDGKCAWGRMELALVHGKNRDRTAVLAMIHDITAEVEAFERVKQSEDNLRDLLRSVQQSESRFKRLIHSAPVGIALADHKGQVTEANDVLLRLLGYSSDDLTSGRVNWNQVLATEYRLSEAEAKSANGHTASEKEVVAKDGAHIPVLVSGVIPSNGNMGEAVISVVDLREAKQKEAQLSRLVMAVENAFESIVITAPDASIVYVNPAFEKLTGYSRAEVMGKNPRLLGSGKTSPQDFKAMWTAIRNGEVWRGRFTNRRKDGSEYVEDATVTPVRSPNGRIINYLAVKRDITREIELEQQLLQSQKMEAIGQLAGGVAHDLNNVLQVIHSSSELAIRRVEDSDYRDKKLNDILLASQRGASIVGQLLAFGRRQTFNLQVVDLNEVIRETNKMLERLLREDIQLFVELDPELQSINADSVQITQVLLNLAVNARDAMPNGGMLKIQTTNCLMVPIDGASGDSGGGFVKLSVVDTGSGIDPAVQPKIFEPFFTTKEVGKGTGLGLSTVYGIVKQSGGEIVLDSKSGHGTRFDIYFPALASAGECGKTATTRSPISRTGNSVGV